MEEDDLTGCQRELGIYEEAIQSLALSLKLMHVYASMGATEDSLRRYQLACFSNSRHDEAVALHVINTELNPQKYVSNRAYVRSLFNRQIKSKSHTFEDMSEWAELMRDRTIPFFDIGDEYSRVLSESKDLLKLQVDWLQESQHPQTTLMDSEPLPNSLPGLPEITPSVTSTLAVPITPPYALSGWELSWTNKFWSSQPSHLVPLPSQSRQALTAAISEVGRGTVSVKPSSVARSIEFHLHDRDTIQKALASRNRYALGESRDWVKVKRGRDRVGILVELDTNKAIVFAGGRDEVYKRK